MWYKHAQQQNKGFTLIEAVVSVSIFVTVMMVSAGALLSIIDANRKSHALKSVMDNLNFALENIARTARVGSDYVCGPESSNPNPNPPNCPVVQPGDTYNRVFKFTSQRDEPVYYKFAKDSVTNKGRIYISVDNEPYEPLTSNQLDIQDMRFYVSGEGNAAAHPRVVISLNGRAGEGKYVSNFNIQTTISQR